MMIIMLFYMVHSNMKTHKDGVSGNIIPKPNVARLMANTLVLNQVVKNLLLSPCWKNMCVKQWECHQEETRRHDAFEASQEEYFRLVQ